MCRITNMETIKFRIFLVWSAYFLGTTKAFLPRIYLAMGNSATLDHALITKKGFFAPLVYFLKDNPQYLKDGTLTRFLLDAQKSDSPNALKDTIDSISPQIKFLNALNEIQSANVEVDSSPLNSSASAHFDGEQFKQGSQRIVRLRQELITSLLKGDTLQHARNLAGMALHTLQDFYSHSNWIELGNSNPYDVLGRPESEIPEEFIAGPTESTCTNCFLDPGTGLPDGVCERNLITMKLTSGYRSGQDIEKPKNVGKCSHGGKMDKSRLMSAKGGINKDTTSMDESPHASHRTIACIVSTANKPLVGTLITIGDVTRNIAIGAEAMYNDKRDTYDLHKIAADLAVEATSTFLGDIRKTVGDDVFAKFLNLNSEKSLALVIDVSGSMSDEISEVKEKSIGFVRNTAKNKGTTFTYILVPFSDPEVGPVTVTNDAQKVIDAVNSLTANGGGDCPELAMAGLYQALLRCLPESTIYFFSDADAKDEQRRNEVSFLAKEKKVKIIFILTGGCSRRKKRQSLPLATIKDIHRVRRNSQARDVYQALATETGGQVLETSKSGVADVIKLIDPGSATSSSVDLIEVDLLNVKESRTQYFSRVAYFVDIDSTLKSLILVLSVAGSPTLEVSTIEGISAMQKKVLSRSSKLFILEVTSLVSGSLQVTVSCDGPYTLQVSGYSLLDFTYQLSDVEDLERGTTRRVAGNPLRGQTLLLTLDFVGREIRNVSNLTLVGIDGTDLETFNITQGNGYYQDSYFVTFTPTAEEFRLKVTGKDKSGARFQRIKPTLFTLGDVKLSLNVGNTKNSNAIFPGETFEVEINVENSGDSQLLYFTASDDMTYFRSISPSQTTIGKNGTSLLRVTLVAPNNAPYGVTTTVTVFVSQNSDFSQVVNFMVFFVTVASKHPDLSPPSCTIMEQSASCARVYGTPDCVSSTWRARVMFTDAGEGLLSITTRDNLRGTLTVSDFSPGAVNTSISASYTADCCNPRVIFVGLDLVGNTGTCSVSFVPDIVSLSAKPNSTSVSLNHGDITKVPFTLTNLGSKGSFSFHVTKTSEFISYVVPLSLTLETNASATGHVMIKSRGDTDEVRNLTVNAVSKLSNVNVKEVTLFKIQVSVSSRRVAQPTTQTQSPVTVATSSSVTQPTKQTQSPTSITESTTSALTHAHLKASVPYDHFAVMPGERIQVNFTVKNLASANTFKLNILSNHSSIKGVLQPATVTLKTTQATSCLLILTSHSEATPGIVIEINVTATSVSRNAHDKKVLLFSLTVKVIGRAASKTEYLQNERKLAVWHVVLISISTLVVILLVAVLLVVRLKRASWSPKKHAEHENDIKPGSASSHLLQLQKFDEEAVDVA